MERRFFERTAINTAPPFRWRTSARLPTGPKDTNQKLFDVGTKKTTDNPGTVKSAQLTNIALTAPYLHDGSARTLEEIWTIYNPEDKHGRTNDYKGRAE